MLVQTMKWNERMLVFSYNLSLHCRGISKQLPENHDDGRLVLFFEWLWLS
jgi:hypothetical protein